MTEAQSDQTVLSGWPQEVSRRVKEDGAWQTLSWLQAERAANPNELALRGYVEILRATIVRDFLALSVGLKSVPKLTPAFLSDFDKFNLTAQEGYLISQIDGRTNIEKLLKLSPFDPFTTLFSFARMQNVAAIEIPE